MTITRGRRRVALTALTAGTLLLAAGCGSDTDSGAAATTTAVPATTAGSTTEASTTAAPGATAAAAFNDADVTFAQGMIAHHEQAIAMAEMALDPLVQASPAVVDLATRIQAAQDPEIQSMTEWLTAWGQPTEMDSSGGHDMSTMDGMMTAGEMDELGAMTGESFDAMWLEMMIRHHEGAIAQSETQKGSGVNADALALADQIITTQRGEIDEMQALLAG